MSITLDRMGEVTVIHIHEKFIDALNAPTLKTEVQSFFKPRMLAVLDLTEVEFLDSSGMGAILASMRHLNSMEGQLKLAGVSKPVQTLFELVRFNRILDIFPTLEDALKAFNHTPRG
jgi:anti-sigma B factor antagonist